MSIMQYLIDFTKAVALKAIQQMLMFCLLYIF